MAPARVENYTTTVSAAKTAGEIQALLAAHGVQRLMLEYAEGKPTGVTFQMETVNRPGFRGGSVSWSRPW